MDPEPERAIEPITDDLYQPSYKFEQLLSEASNVSFPSRRTPLDGYSTPHQPPCRRISAAISAIRLFHFEDGWRTFWSNDPYPHLSPGPRATPTAYWPTPWLCSSRYRVRPICSRLPPAVFFDHQPARSPSAPPLLPANDPLAQSLVGTSAPLLTNPSLTDYLSNYPIWPLQVNNSNMSMSRPSSPLMEDAVWAPKPPTAPSSKRGRRRPRKKLRVSRQRKIPARNEMWLRHQGQRQKRGRQTSISWCNMTA